MAVKATSLPVTLMAGCVLTTFNLSAVLLKAVNSRFGLSWYLPIACLKRSYTGVLFSGGVLTKTLVANCFQWSAKEASPRT